MARPGVSRKANGVKVKRPYGKKFTYTSSRRLHRASCPPDLRFPICNCGRLHVSRAPVRDALRKLVIEGFLEQTPDGSVCVTRLSRQDIIDLFDLRKLLKSTPFEK